MRHPARGHYPQNGSFAYAEMLRRYSGPVREAERYVPSGDEDADGWILICMLVVVWGLVVAVGLGVAIAWFVG